MSLVVIPELMNTKIFEPRKLYFCNAVILKSHTYILFISFLSVISAHETNIHNMRCELNYYVSDSRLGVLLFCTTDRLHDDRGLLLEPLDVGAFLFRTLHH